MKTSAFCCIPFIQFKICESITAMVAAPVTGCIHVFTIPHPLTCTHTQCPASLPYAATLAILTTGHSSFPAVMRLLEELHVYKCLNWYILDEK